LEPRSVSFNSAYGACKRCNGIGTVMEIDVNKIVPDPSLPVNKIEFLGGADRSGAAFLKSALMAIIERYVDGDKLEPPKSNGSVRKRGKRKKNDPPPEKAAQRALVETPFVELPDEIRNAFLLGTKKRLTFRQGDYKYESDWKGALRAMKERLEDPPSEKTREALFELVGPVPCPTCKGARLQPESLAVKVGGLGIAEYSALPIDEAVEKFNKIKLNAREEK